MTARTDPVLIRRAGPIRACGWAEDSYRLIDSGGGRKLENFGGVLVDRPDAQALWKPQRPIRDWGALAVYSGQDADSERGAWRFAFSEKSPPWQIGWERLRLELRFSSFRHLGLFPEHSSQWRWVMQRAAASSGQMRLLNLFAYTGAMSLAAASVGAHVTHVDASAAAIRHGRRNQALSGLTDAPIRWLREDVLSFVRREERRESRYDVIVADPPTYGRGPGTEIWRLERNFAELSSLAARLIAADGCIILTVYATRLSPLAVAQALAGALAGRGGVVSYGDLAIAEEYRAVDLPTAIWVRWTGGRSDADGIS